MKETGHIAQRQVYCEDAIAWLEGSPSRVGSSLVASLPDISEFPGFTLAQWKEWFVKTAALVLSRTPHDGVTVFYQSDIKLNGAWIDKGYLCEKAAEIEDHELLWHKVGCRVAPGHTTFGRPGYTHILCFSRTLRLDPARSSSDVIADLGEKSWGRGMGLEACSIIGTFIAEQTSSRTVIHPFCGQGGMLAVANALGLSAVGIERSPKRAEIARRLTVDLKAKKWCFLQAVLSEAEAR